MEDKELYEKLLGVKEPWDVIDVTVDMQKGCVAVKLGHPKGTKFPCPVCGELCAIYDHEKRRWRHLDSCGFITILEANVPRICCKDHGVKQVSIPWAESGSRFTALFEAIAISWLKVASISDVAKILKISWEEASGIMERAVKRGLKRRVAVPVKALAIDETSFQKRHEYVTVLYDRERDCVIDILDGRKKETLQRWLKDNQDSLKELDSVTMDMWDAYIGAVKETIPDAEEKICFDRFHVARYFTKAVDKVRADEHREYKAKYGTSPLTKTRYMWLRSKESRAEQSTKDFAALSRMNLKTARAWWIKESAGELWTLTDRKDSEAAWRRLLGWTARCRLRPMIEVGRTIRNYLWGILNATVKRATNAKVESVNAIIQKLKVRACGFRNRARFKMAILFHCGKLSLLPEVLL